MESTRGRNLKIVMMVRAGKSYPKISKELGISATRVGQIFHRHQELAAYANSPFGSLDVKAYNVLKRFFECKLEKPLNLIELKRFVDKNEDWESQLRLSRSCGEQILSQIKEFMAENGIL